MSALLKILLLQTWVLNLTIAARILAVFPTPSISHQVAFRPLSQELARRGHQITVITTDPAFPKGKTPRNLTEIDVHDLSYKIWMESFMKASKGGKSDLHTSVKIAIKMLTVVLDAQLESEEIQNIINENNSTYDLLLLEACVRPTLVFSYLFKAPVIAVSSFGAVTGNYEVIGAPVHPILYPSMFRERIYNLTMWEKITEVFSHYQMFKMFDNAINYENEILKQRFGPETPEIEELSNNIDMLFLNVHPLFEGIRPVPPSVIYMGGIHQKPTKPLPSDLKKYLDSSKSGVIYVSFGTNVDSTLLPAEKVRILVRVFSKVPYNVLFKWDDDELSGRTDNIKISKWLPQSDLLKHSSIKLFITQGGLQSTDEAITAGVPLIGIPMLGDQWYNTEKYVHNKIGLRLDLTTLTEQQLIHAINTVIGDESYRQNVVKLRSLMMDQPMTPLDRAVWWIEYVIRHGGAKHLRSPAANISWSDYLELKLVLNVLAMLLSIILMSIASVYLLYKYVTNNNKQKKN